MLVGAKQGASAFRNFLRFKSLSSTSFVKDVPIMMVSAKKDDIVTVHIRKIREKIENDPSNPLYIETLWGAGYRFRGE